MYDYYLLVNKTHPLSADYIPSDLVRPKIPFAEEGTGPHKNTASTPEKFLMERTAALAIEQLFAIGLTQNIHLYGVSGYRSYERQKAIYETSVRTRGQAHTDKYIAPPGCSEHQSGLAMDVSIPALDFQLEESFDTTKEGKWLKKFAPLYGFIIRYPKGLSHITGYQYEPWHIRYVTKPISLYLSKTHLTLEEYHRISKQEKQDEAFAKATI